MKTTRLISIPALLAAIALCAVSNVALIDDAQAGPTKALSKQPSSSSVKPRDGQRQSMGSRARSRSSMRLAPRQAAQNVEKAAQRRSTGQSATAVPGNTGQPTSNATTPAGTQPVAVAPVPAPPRSTQRTDAAARATSATRTTASGKTKTLASSAAK